LWDNRGKIKECAIYYSCIIQIPPRGHIRRVVGNNNIGKPLGTPGAEGPYRRFEMEKHYQKPLDDLGTLGLI
jgi:hypothetical protein